jgi:hypothetical protein
MKWKTSFLSYGALLILPAWPSDSFGFFGFLDFFGSKVHTSECERTLGYFPVFKGKRVWRYSNAEYTAFRLGNGKASREVIRIVPRDTDKESFVVKEYKDIRVLRDDVDGFNYLTRILAGYPRVRVVKVLGTHENTLVLEDTKGFEARALKNHKDYWRSIPENLQKDLDKRIADLISFVFRTSSADPEHPRVAVKEKNLVVDPVTLDLVIIDPR